MRLPVSDLMRPDAYVELLDTGKLCPEASPVSVVTFKAGDIITYTESSERWEVVEPGNYHTAKALRVAL